MNNQNLAPSGMNLSAMDTFYATLTVLFLLEQYE